ncbi:hypothetical protein V8G54_015773 [Vigna mungo]|uniref:Uncharacterized protein n=1 Tax=Vigna mungo TaxID=3915 RepID=A0AAQ3NMV5_VIGMU
MPPCFLSLSRTSPLSSPSLHSLAPLHSPRCNRTTLSNTSTTCTPLLPTLPRCVLLPVRPPPPRLDSCCGSVPRSPSKLLRFRRKASCAAAKCSSRPLFPAPSRGASTASRLRVCPRRGGTRRGGSALPRSPRVCLRFRLALALILLFP